MPKNFRNITKFIRSKIGAINTEKIIVASVIRLSRVDIHKNKYKEIGISYEENNNLVFPDKFTPKAYKGKASRVNIRGKTIVRKDLPMISKTYSFETPNYGDWSKGSHEVSFDKKVYLREKISPYNIEISVQKIKEDENDIVFGFTAGKPLKKEDEENLLFSLNLLQESFGRSDVFSTDEVLKEKVAYSSLKWEILPPGWWSDKTQISKITSKLGSKAGQLFVERLKYAESLKPDKSYIGESYLGNRLYYIFVFPNIVMAECPMFGNALYYLSEENIENWKEIFAKSKKEALSLGAHRLLHIGTWKSKLNKFVHVN